MNLGRFIACVVTSGIHLKEWFLTTTRLTIEPDNRVVAELIEEADRILNAERANVLAALPLVQMDSRLGWEPSMEYLGDEWHIRWKIRHGEYVLNTELARWRASVLL